MARYVLSLTDAHRAAVEGHRVARGLRSHAEAIRDLIERGAGPMVDATPQWEAGELTSIPHARPAWALDVGPIATQGGDAVHMPSSPLKAAYGSRLKKR